MFLLNLNWIGGLGTSVSKTRTLPGVYSLIVPVLSAPEPVLGLEVCPWAKPMKRAAAQTTPSIDLIIVFPLVLRVTERIRPYGFPVLRGRGHGRPKDRHRAQGVQPARSGTQS